MAIAGRDVQGAAPPYALIVFVMLTVILAAGAVWLYLTWDRSAQELAEVQDRQQRLLTSRQAKDQPYKTVEAEALQAQGRPSVVSYLISQRDELRSDITADASLSNADIRQKIAAALQAARDSLGQEREASLLGMKLLAVIETLSQAYASQSQELSGCENSLAVAEKRAKQAEDAMKAVRSSADQHRAEVDSQMQARQALVMAQLKKWDANLDTLRNELNNLSKTLATEKGKARDEVEAIQKSLTQNKRRLQALLDKVQMWRKESGIDFTAVVGQADGKIVSIVPGQNKVFIDIGQAEHLPLSLQFEVFSPVERITESSRSKGTIEVIRVGPELSECQIVRTAHEQSINAGDLIVNAVYDRENKYVFRVIGEFDVDGNGRADPNGAKNVEVLIKRWGGEVVDELKVQTDFLVVGWEPRVPAKPDEFDLAAMALYEQRLKEYKAYLDAQDRATELSIPMLNHKRFVYLLGLGDRLPQVPLGYDESDPWPP